MENNWEIEEKINSGVFQLIQKRKGKSEIWATFAQILKDDDTILDGFVCCRKCKKIYKYNGKQSSNLNRHKCFNLTLRSTSLESIEWTKATVLEMIKLWKTNELFYNPNHKHYSNKYARKDALNDMATKLNKFNPAIGPGEVKIKMAYLRGQYSREISRIKERNDGTDAEDVYVPTPYWFSELSFLDNFMSCRNHNSNQIKREDSPSQQEKKLRLTIDDMSQPSCEVNQEEETQIFLSSAPKNKIRASNEKDEAFCNYIKTELNELTNGHIKDELIEVIMLAVFEAKKKERMSYHNNENSNVYNYDST